MSVDLDMPDASLQPGDHVCAFYFGDTERDEILFAFLGAGLLAGAKCLCLIDQETPAYVVERLRSRSDIPRPRQRTDSLEVEQCRDVYLAKGRFSSPDMIGCLGEKLSAALDSGYEQVRLAGEMSWVLSQPPGVEQLLDYESEINRHTSGTPQILLCMYDLALIGGAPVVELLKTHPKVVLGGMVLDNPHCLSPDDFLAARA